MNRDRDRTAGLFLGLASKGDSRYKNPGYAEDCDNVLLRDGHLENRLAITVIGIKGQLQRLQGMTFYNPVDAINPVFIIVRDHNIDIYFPERNYRRNV